MFEVSCIGPMEVREDSPPTPWVVQRYVFSLATVKDNNGQVVLDSLNVNIAEFIVEKVNATRP